MESCKLCGKEVDSIVHEQKKRVRTEEKGQEPKIENRQIAIN
jgi:hypothetical protein